MTVTRGCYTIPPTRGSESQDLIFPSPATFIKPNASYRTVWRVFSTRKVVGPPSFPLDASQGPMPDSPIGDELQWVTLRVSDGDDG